MVIKSKSKSKSKNIIKTKKGKSKRRNVDKSRKNIMKGGSHSFGFSPNSWGKVPIKTNFIATEFAPGQVNAFMNAQNILKVPIRTNAVYNKYFQEPQRVAESGFPVKEAIATKMHPFGIQLKRTEPFSKTHPEKF